MPLVFVYGSLKKDGEYHHEMMESRFVGLFNTPAIFLLKHDSYGYPAAVQGGSLTLQGEVYQVTDTHLLALDVFEGLSYVRTPLITSFGHSWIYLLKA